MRPRGDGGIGSTRAVTGYPATPWPIFRSRRTITGTRSDIHYWAPRSSAPSQTPPLLLPNLLFSLGIASLFLATCQLFLRRWESLLLMLLLIVLLKRDLTISLIHPWNTIPTHFISYLVMFLYLQRRHSGRLVLLLSTLTGLTYAFRPLEAVILSPILLAATLSLRGLRDKLAFGTGGIGLLALPYLATRMINLQVFGTWNTVYERNHASWGLPAYDIAHKTYSIFIDGFPVYQTADSMLLESQPWLLLIIPGAFYAFTINRKILAVLFSLSLNLFLYANFHDLGSRKLYETGLIHYFTVSFPLLGLFSYFSIRRAWKVISWPLYLALIIIPALLVGSIRLDAVNHRSACIGFDGKVLFDKAREQAGEAKAYIALLRTGQPEAPTQVVMDGVLLARIRDYRETWRPDQGAVALHFAEALDPSRNGLRLHVARGTPALFHGLDWHCAPGQSRLWAGIGRRFGLEALAPAHLSSLTGKEGSAAEPAFGECDPLPVP